MYKTSIVNFIGSGKLLYSVEVEILAGEAKFKFWRIKILYIVFCAHKPGYILSHLVTYTCSYFKCILTVDISLDLELPMQSDSYNIM